MLVAVLHWRNLCLQILFTAYRPCIAIPRYFSLHLLLCFKDVRSQQNQSAPHSNLSAPENVIGRKGAPISNHKVAMKGCVVGNLVPLCFDDLTAILEHLKVQRRQRQRHEDRWQGQVPPEDTVTGKQIKQSFHGNFGLLWKELFRLVVHGL